MSSRGPVLRAGPPPPPLSSSEDESSEASDTDFSALPAEGALGERGALSDAALDAMLPGSSEGYKVLSPHGGRFDSGRRALSLTALIACC